MITVRVEFFYSTLTQKVTFRRKADNQQVLVYGYSKPVNTSFNLVMLTLNTYYVNICGIIYP